MRGGTRMGLAAACVLAAIWAGGALAQEAIMKPEGMPEDVAAMLREIGPVIEAERTGAAYAEMHPVRPFEDVSVSADIAYGPHERNVLDVFTAPDAGAGLPVLVFVHGGGFVGGTKHREGSPFYDNVSRWAALNGMVGVQLTYRLAPEHKYPSGVEDLGLAMDWLKANIAAHGGDPEKIILWGHSAGASHVADYIAAHADAPGIAGAVLMSGVYDPADRGESPYYGPDAEPGTLAGLLATDIPLLVVDGTIDTGFAVEQAAMLAEALEEAGRPVRRVRLANHSHISEGYAVGTADTSLTAPLKDFVFEAAAAD